MATNLALLVYLAELVESISNYIVTVSIFTMIGWFWECIHLDKMIRPRWFAIIGMILITVNVFIPSKDTIYIITGVKASEQVYDTISTSKIGTQVQTIIEQKLDEMIEQKTPEKK